MFETLDALPPDPILGLSAAFREDPREHKIDLGVGVYRTEEGTTPVMAAVKEAERQLLQQQDSKVYLPPAGTPAYNARLRALIFGESHPVVAGQRCASIQTPGGCGALRVGAEFIVSAWPGARVWASVPTWANHPHLLGSAGVTLKDYPYYDAATGYVDFDAMITALEQVERGDIVLLHGCCHNPSGADLNEAQWRQVSELLREREAIPFVDMAYQGLGDGLDADATGLRLLAEAVPELLMAFSCSKNFGLYRERTGLLAVVTRDAATAPIVESHLCNIARGMYSMPPAHGATIVETILGSAELTQAWTSELTATRERLQVLRGDLVAATRREGLAERFAFVTGHKGMFSILGVAPERVRRLRDDYGIYMVESSRVNIAGLNRANTATLARALAAVVG